MDTIFWICVRLMQLGSNVLGISYQELNVLLFVLLHPALTLFLYFRYRKYKMLWKEAQAGSKSG
jgi:hypothetical protein